jgi:plastocyanin
MCRVCHQLSVLTELTQVSRLVPNCIAAIATSIAFAAAIPGEQGTPAAKTGTVAGAVLFTGKVPPVKKILATDGTTILHNDLIVDAGSEGLRYVAVILDNAPAQPKLKDTKAAEIDQKDMIFTPRVIAVQQGRPVLFTNSDLCNHGVMSGTTTAANQFNIVTPPNQAFKFVFQPQAKPIVIGCPLHDWMKAWVYVLPHPWFAVTDVQGRFTLHDVPQGKYSLWLHHADTGKEERRAITVQGGQTTNVHVQWQSTEKQKV